MAGGAGADVIYGMDRVESYLIANTAANDNYNFVINGITNTHTSADTDEDKTGAGLIALINADVLTTDGVLAAYSTGTDILTLTYSVYHGTPGAVTITGTGQGTAAQTITLEGANAGADTIDGGTGSDTVQGGAGADTITLGSGGSDDVVIAAAATNTAISVAATATSLTATIANGDTLTFGSGVDVINGFVSGTDDLFVSTATAIFEGIAPTALVGATAANLAATTAYQARGDYVASTGVFTLSATGADTLFTINDGTAADDVASTNTNYQILVGVTALVAGDLI